MSEKYDGVLA